jgi:hypothetical protein
MDHPEERIFGRFDDSTWNHPGHRKDSTLGVERPHLGLTWPASRWATPGTRRDERYMAAPRLLTT